MIHRQKSHFNRSNHLSDPEDGDDEIVNIETISDHFPKEKKDGVFNFSLWSKSSKKKKGEPANKEALHTIVFPRGNLRGSYERHDVQYTDLEEKGPCVYGRPRSPRALRGRPLVMADKDAIVIEESTYAEKKNPKTFEQIQNDILKEAGINITSLDKEFGDVSQGPRGMRYGWHEEDLNQNKSNKTSVSNRVYHYIEKTQRIQVQISRESPLEEIEDAPPRYEEAETLLRKNVEPLKNFQRPPEGSYPNMTPSEEKNLQPILRLTWKGDAEKLTRYLENERRWGKINLQVDSSGRTALHLASSFGDESLLNILLGIPGIDLNLRDSSGMTPLFKTAQIKSVPCIVRLLESGADPLICCNDGRNVLQYLVIEYGDAFRHCIKTLFDHKGLREDPPSPTDGEFGQFSILHYACSAEPHISVKKISKIFINNGVDLDARDDKGRTPLMLAAKNNRGKMVQLLMMSGADPDLKDNENEKALQYAIPDTKTHHLLSRSTKMEDHFSSSQSSTNNNSDDNHQEEMATPPTNIHPTNSQCPTRRIMVQENSNVENSLHNFGAVADTNGKQPSEKEIRAISRVRVASV